jgi:hypothetical protein
MADGLLARHTCLSRGAAWSLDILPLVSESESAFSGYVPKCPNPRRLWRCRCWLEHFIYRNLVGTGTIWRDNEAYK